MGTAATVGVNDDLATREARVAVRSADDELACRVDIEFHVVAEKLLQTRGELLLYPRDEDVLHVVLDLLLHGRIVGKLVVLCADDDGVDTDRLPAFVVFHRHLRLGIGAEVGHLFAFAADVGQLL